MPSSAWAGWINVESLVEVEAAKGVPYRRPILRAAQLWYEVYCSCGGEGLRCNVLHRRRSLNFQYPVRAEPLVFLTSLWGELLKTLLSSTIDYTEINMVYNKISIPCSLHWYSCMPYFTECNGNMYGIQWYTEPVYPSNKKNILWKCYLHVRQPGISKLRVKEIGSWVLQPSKIKTEPLPLSKLCE